MWDEYWYNIHKWIISHVQSMFDTNPKILLTDWNVKEIKLKYDGCMIFNVTEKVSPSLESLIHVYVTVSEDLIIKGYQFCKDAIPCRTRVLEKNNWQKSSCYCTFVLLQFFRLPFLFKHLDCSSRIVFSLFSYHTLKRLLSVLYSSCFIFIFYSVLQCRYSTMKTVFKIFLRLICKCESK